MAYDPKQPPEEKKSLFGVIMHSFFVVPFLLAVFSILLFAAVRILTMEKSSVHDYLRDVKEGGATKRWQAAFELSRILSNKNEVPSDGKFVDQMVEAFESSAHDDDRVRQYMAMAMARTGNEKFVGPLLEALPLEKDENLYAIITALGILKDNKAVDVLLQQVQNESPRIRLASVIALGNIGDPKALPALKARLDDPEPNVTWDAAVALAKMGDQSGRGIILNLLDRNYLNSFPNLDPRDQSRIITVAIQASEKWYEPQINAALQKLFESDPNMNVRSLAHNVLLHHGGN